jgi:uncharacterized protein YcbX
VTLTVQDLRIHPVKALRGYARETVSVAPWGIETDRRWMVVRPDGRFLTQRDFPAMARITAEATATGLVLSAEGRDAVAVAFPDAATRALRQVTVWSDTVPALDAGPEAAAWLSTALEEACGLVYLADTRARPVDPEYGQPDDHAAFSDGFPVLLTTMASLKALNAALPEAIPMNRFRPNIVVDGAAPWAEDRWRRIRIGTIVFRVAKPCARCIVTTIDQHSGARPDKSEPLKTLSRIRRTAEGVIFGQNLIPETQGRIAVGDRVEILESGASNVSLLSRTEPPA